MRIIAGQFKRRTILANPGMTTRPITDRVKESLFEHLSSIIPDAHVADIFSGTGTLGLEALSRGARHVTFIERDRKAVELLKENVARLKVEDDTLIWPADVTKCSFRPKGGVESKPWDVIFFDPPYKLVQYIKPGDSLYKSIQRLARDDVSTETAEMMFRTPMNAKFELPPEWIEFDCLKRSKMEIHLLRKFEVRSEEK